MRAVLQVKPLGAPYAVAILVLLLMGMGGCGSSSSPAPATTPATGPKLTSQEVIGIVKNTLSERHYNFDDERRSCLRGFSSGGFEAAYKEDSIWVVENAGAQWQVSERTLMATWLTTAISRDCDF